MRTGIDHTQTHTHIHCSRLHQIFMHHYWHWGYLKPKFVGGNFVENGIMEYLFTR